MTYQMALLESKLEGREETLIEHLPKTRRESPLHALLRKPRKLWGGNGA